MKTIACLLAVTMACSPVLAQAQATAQATAASTTQVPVTVTVAAETVPAQAPVPDAMPLSLSRVQRRLLAAEVAKPSTAPGLRIEEFVNVYGKSIAFDIMKDYDVKATAVQYGGMTHTEFLDLVTPKMYRQPTVDFISLAVGAAKWAATRAAEKRRKAEQERIEEEARRMRELGVAPPK
jgi:hypothetical protein